jgi:hypothetical protein
MERRQAAHDLFQIEAPVADWDEMKREIFPDTVMSPHSSARSG